MWNSSEMRLDERLGYRVGVIPKPRVFTPLVEKEGRGSVYWPLRVALSGLQASPDPLEIAEILGKEEVIRRIAAAVEKLKNAA